MAKASAIKAKKKCCKSRTRCKRCRVVMKRLERAGLAERVGKRHYVIDPGISKKQLRAARARSA